jgi:hydroxymethylpyrimidine pyrophosphatase-like HAD family hydrolase
VAAAGAAGAASARVTGSGAGLACVAGTPTPTAEMDLDDDLERGLARFAAMACFARSGAVITDLDGTAVHEHAGRIAIPTGVEHGLKRVRALGRPVVLNSLRFPLSILRSFGHEWYAVSDAPLPTVSLNGSLLGWLTRSDSGELAFDELEAFPLDPGEIEGAVARVDALLHAGLQELIVFWYPRDWTLGERIWCFGADRVAPVAAKYPSASRVEAGDVAAMRRAWAGHDLCMAMLLADVPQDRLMAYQHAERERFVVHAGVDKLSGARRLAERLQVDLADSVGAGDTEMDTFLNGVGLAVAVGPAPPPYAGLHGTLRVRDPAQLGLLFGRLAELHGARPA